MDQVSRTTTYLRLAVVVRFFENACGRWTKMLRNTASK